jgi:hypothetical protein
MLEIIAEFPSQLLNQLDHDLQIGKILGHRLTKEGDGTTLIRYLQKMQQVLKDNIKKQKNDSSFDSQKEQAWSRCLINIHKISNSLSTSEIDLHLLDEDDLWLGKTFPQSRLYADLLASPAEGKRRVYELRKRFSKLKTEDQASTLEKLIDINFDTLPQFLVLRKLTEYQFRKYPSWADTNSG